MRTFVVRHGCAGDKRQWALPDAERPLDDSGLRQADALAELLARTTIRRIATSPTRRCRDTVVPLARRIGLPVDELDSLGPQGSGDELLALITNGDAADAVLCTHGENMKPALATIRADGAQISPQPGGPVLAKGTLWTVTVDAAGRIAALDYVAPGANLACPTHGPTLYSAE